MMQSSLDFRWLKQRVSIARFLAHRGLGDRLRVCGNKLIGPCPIHGGDNPSAFVVDRQRNLWHCFTGCQAGGDLIDLVQRIDGTGYRQVAYTLSELADNGLGTMPSVVTQLASRPFKTFKKRLSLDSHHPFLQKKGISPQTARRFDVGAYRGKGMLEDCIAVRLHDPFGHPLGYVGRRLQPEPRCKWVFPPSLPKSRLLYHYHCLRPPRQGPIIIVEDPWSVLRLEQLHFPAVSLLGVSLSIEQKQLLQTFNPKLIMLDGDSPGRLAQQRICSFLNVMPIWLEDGLDPDDLSDKQLQRLIIPHLSL